MTQVKRGMQWTTAARDEWDAAVDDLIETDAAGAKAEAFLRTHHQRKMGAWFRPVLSWLRSMQTKNKERNARIAALEATNDSLHARVVELETAKPLDAARIASLEQVTMRLETATKALHATLEARLHPAWDSTTKIYRPV